MATEASQTQTIGPTATTVSVAGKRAIVTGANSGLGLHTTIGLAAAGAKVVMACRNTSKAQLAVETIKSQVPDADLEVRQLDLASLQSITEFATELQNEGAPLDLLINNAGLMAIPQASTADGFERQFGTNHLGHFALTAQLLSLLDAAEKPRVVSVTSGLAARGTIDFNNLNAEQGYSRWAAYEQSKLANLVFAQEFARRLTGAGSKLLSVAAHPGYSATNLQSNDGPLPERLFMAFGNRVFATPAEYGARPTLLAATSTKVASGDLVGPTKFAQMRGPIEVVPPPGRSHKLDVAAKLWDVSQELTGVDFGLKAL